MYKSVEREAFIDFVRVKSAEFQGGNCLEASFYIFFKRHEGFGGILV